MDDKRLEDFGYRALLEHYHEAIPEIRTKTMSIPGMSGQWNFGSERGSKPFEIPIEALGLDSLDLQRKQNDLVAFLMDEFGNPRPIKMVFDYEPDKFYMVEISDSVAPTLKAHIIRGQSLPFIAHDSFKHSNVYADEVTWGSEDITFESDYLLGHTNDFGDEYVNITGPETLLITVSGIAIQPVFEINGTANNLTISANGYSFTLPNFTNTKWTIDFEKYLVYKNGQETMIEIREFYLMPRENEIKVTGSNINIQLAVKYRDKYN